MRRGDIKESDIDGKDVGRCGGYLMVFVWPVVVRRKKILRCPS